MPSEKVLGEKQAYVQMLTEKMKKSSSGILVDYKGIDVEHDTALRKNLREAGVDYFVVKNSMLRFAIKELGLDALEGVLSGTTALALSEGDPIEAAKILAKQAEEKPELFNLKAGFVDGAAIDAATVNQYAKVPTKEVLLSQLVFMLASPMQKLAIAVSEVAKKNGEPEAVQTTEAAAE